ncbi:MAG TPA: hypothetical protein VG738_19915 [Chitinophagaceae bacterium]|nr:hypothetical protein [Chitinophagaceae bacterium]
MLLKSDIRKILKKELGAFLKTYGYKPQAKESGFIRKTKEGNTQIGISIVDYRPKFLLGIPFSIRLEAVEKISNYLFNTMPEYQSETTTIVVPGKFFTGIDEYKITNVEGLQEFIDFFKKLYTGKVDYFLSNNSTLQGIVETLFTQHIEFGKIFQHYDFITRIIIARLGKIEHYDFVAEKYYKIYCENYPDSKEEQAEIRRAIEYLKTVNPDKA